MKAKLISKIGFAAFLSIFVSVAFGQPKTVTDFYLALPTDVDEIAGMDEVSRTHFGEGFFYPNERNRSKSAVLKYRKSLIKIEDIKNGYLRLESNEWEGWVEIALFKKTDGNYLVAFSEVGCGPDCSGDVMFLTYEDGEWTNVTKKVFPAESSPEGFYELPRYGTTIRLNKGEDCGDDKDCRRQQKADEFKWNGTKFIKQEKTK